MMHFQARLPKLATRGTPKSGTSCFNGPPGVLVGQAVKFGHQGTFPDNLLISTTRGLSPNMIPKWSQGALQSKAAQSTTLPNSSTRGSPMTNCSKLQGSYAALFCPFILLRTFKTQNVLLSHFKDAQLSFCLLILPNGLKIDPKLVIWSNLFII